MKNYEKYADELKEYKGVNFCKDFVKPNILKSEVCGGLACGACYMLQTIWLLEDCEEPEEPETDWSKVEVDTPIRLMKEYEEPQVDWSKVEVDTPILVRYDDKAEWFKRHFAKYENGLVYAWKDRCTSWTVLHDKEVTAWTRAKLAESEEE